MGFIYSIICLIECVQMCARVSVWGWLVSAVKVPCAAAGMTHACFGTHVRTVRKTAQSDLPPSPKAGELSKQVIS